MCQTPANLPALKTGIKDSTGTVLQEYSYSVFGEIDGIVGDSINNPFTYTGGEWDEELGLYFYRARYYDPEIGRFMSEDPIYFHGGDGNLYRYVWNNPAILIDPMGKSPSLGIQLIKQFFIRLFIMPSITSEIQNQPDSPPQDNTICPVDNLRTPPPNISPDTVIINIPPPPPPPPPQPPK